MKKKQIQVHGKTETFQPTTLDQVWGDTGLSKYKTLNVEEYRATLAEMNKSDLQREAAKHGIVPIDDRDILTKKLIKEFQLYTASFSQPRNNRKPVTLSKKAWEILSEGG